MLYLLESLQENWWEKGRKKRKIKASEIGVKEKRLKENERYRDCPGHFWARHFALKKKEIMINTPNIFNLKLNNPRINESAFFDLIGLLLSIILKIKFPLTNIIQIEKCHGLSNKYTRRWLSASTSYFGQTPT